VRDMHVAVVGSGPAGFYATKYLLKGSPEARVDLIEKLPTPFGLVRSGVAPDHPEVKNVQADFDSVAEEFSEAGRFRYFGNVEVGADVSVGQLREQYDAVVLACGAPSDKALPIEGEVPGRVTTARAFVNWYNGHPDHAADGWGSILAEAKHVLVLGQGNVALDCARVLSKAPEDLAGTDIAAHALEALRRSQVQVVHVVGRRGHIQAAFTMKELRELSRIEGCRLVAFEEEVEAGMTPASEEERRTSRIKTKIDALLRDPKACYLVPKGAQHISQGREIQLHFLTQPQSIVDGSPMTVHCSRTTLSGPAGEQVAVDSGEVKSLHASLVIKAVGYRSMPLEGVPFDARRGLVPSQAGRVTDVQGPPLRGLYVTGWLRRGPTGIIASNVTCARETVSSVLQDAADGVLSASKHGMDPTTVPNAIDWGEWKRLEAVENARGEAVGKPREKCVSVREMLAIARQ
jgi:adrenodoxin-NADP+ reductase